MKTKIIGCEGEGPLLSYCVHPEQSWDLGVRVRDNFLISSSTLLGLGRVSGTTTANSRTFTPLFTSLTLKQGHEHMDPDVISHKHKQYQSHISSILGNKDTKGVHDG